MSALTLFSPIHTECKMTSFNTKITFSAATASSAATFWDGVQTLTRDGSTLAPQQAQARLEELAASRTGDSTFDAARLEILRFTARRLGLEMPSHAAVPPPPFTLQPGDLPPISTEGAPGTSLVTCCMNREANLLRALDSWLACPDLREIIIVDWSSEHPVSAALQRTGISDPRVRVLRVNDEPRWILSYAFNVGFRAASCSRILKADADIVLAPEFFQKNQLSKGQFIAGNWRTAAEGQSHVNGFFYVHKSDLAAVAGFNEFITTYGWDDDDIYARLSETGLIRQDVVSDTIHHLEHSDEERTGEHRPASSTALAELQADTLFKTRRNRFIANVMPHWNAQRQLLPFKVSQCRSQSAEMARSGWVPNAVPDTIQQDATHYTALEMTAWRLGQRTFGLSRTQLSTLLQKPFSALGRLDVELLLQGAETLLEQPALVVRLQGSEQLQETAALTQLTACARARGQSLVISGPFHLPESGLPAPLADVPFVPDWLDLGPLAPVSAAEIMDPAAAAPAGHAELKLDSGAITLLTGGTPGPQAPAVTNARPRLFIDGQHGLGNRLRAIGSAAAVAERSDRELVIVWQPDAHCDCRFSDLFDYDGAVIEQSFTQDAAQQGCTVYNYMEVEDGANKDALVDTSGSGGIYARAAYVLNSPLSDWNAENAFLQSLRPVAAVQEMVAGVRRPNDVSAHVRMAGGKDYEHLAYEQSDGNWTEEGHQAIAHWREKSHFSHFFKRLDALTAEGRAERIFVAADLPETYGEFKALYGDRVAMLEREVYDRSAEQLRYALADALLLGTSPLLLGSSWSSYSELAMRLSPQKMTIEMSGKDF